MQAGVGWEVVLMRRGSLRAPIAAHERFTIAHEIGHYVLLREADFRPRRTSEYWLGEDLCQHFAASLLLRPRFLDDLRAPRDSENLLACVNALAHRAGVTAEPAARALVGELEVPAAIGTFVLDPLDSTNRLGFRGWWRENRSWWSAGGGRRLAVYVDHPLAPALREMARLPIGAGATPHLAGARSTTLRRRSHRRAVFTAILAERQTRSSPAPPERLSAVGHCAERLFQWPLTSTAVDPSSVTHAN